MEGMVAPASPSTGHPEGPHLPTEVGSSSLVTEEHSLSATWEMFFFSQVVGWLPPCEQYTWETRKCVAWLGVTLTSLSLRFLPCDILEFPSLGSGCM